MSHFKHSNKISGGEATTDVDVPRNVCKTGRVPLQPWKAFHEKMQLAMTRGDTQQQAAIDVVCSHQRKVTSSSGTERTVSSERAVISSGLMGSAVLRSSTP
jgi:hypothetical protein